MSQCDEVVVMDNEALYKICQDNLRLDQRGAADEGGEEEEVERLARDHYSPFFFIRRVCWEALNLLEIRVLEGRG